MATVFSIVTIRYALGIRQIVVRFPARKKGCFSLQSAKNCWGAPSSGYCCSLPGSKTARAWDWQVKCISTEINLSNQMVRLCTNSIFKYCPQTAFMCYVWVSEQRVTFTPHRIISLVSITMTERVYCAVRIWMLNRTDDFLSLNGLEWVEPYVFYAV